MPQINLLNQSAPTKSVDENSAALINMYLQQDQDQGKYQVSAYPTPGLTVFSTLKSPVRAVFTEHGVCYAVGGNTLYSINSSGVSTTLGTLNTSTGLCKIRGINNELYIIDSGFNGYFYKISSNTFSQITSTTYVSFIDMTASGTNYSNPTVVFADATGTGASGTATVINGQITSVTITAQGHGYTAPTVSFTDATGSGATATVFTTTSTYPTNIIDIMCQDEFGIGINQNSQSWNTSAISDLSTWPALSIAATTGNQNNLMAVASLYRYIWFFGTETTEIWYNAGNQLFTWARLPTVFLEWGCAATQSVALGNNTLFFLGQAPSGGVTVCMVNNYTPVRISTDGIDYQISTYGTISDAFGFCYIQEGHEFYVLTFPTTGVTWVYDITTKLWHQRQSLINSSQTRWSPSCYTFCYNKQLVGDSQSGNIYQLDMTNQTENGTPITRTIQTHPFYQDGAYIYCDKLQIDFDQTPGAQLANINLYVSRDGGHTFGAAKPATPVQTSDGQWRCYWNRLGKARTWVFKIQTTLAGQFIVLGAWANFHGGTQSTYSGAA